MTRTLALTLVLVMGAMGISSTAQAIPIVDLLWTSTTGFGVSGLDTIDAQPGDVLTLGVFVSLDAGDLVDVYGISLEFDADLQDELNLLSTSEFVPVGFSGNLNIGVDETIESTLLFTAGSVLTYEAFALDPVFAPDTFQIGEAEFEVTGNVNSGPGLDVESGLFNGSSDVSPGNLETAFHGAIVNSALPEPGTLSLLALGVLGLAFTGRRARL